MGLRMKNCNIMGGSLKNPFLGGRRGGGGGGGGSSNDGWKMATGDSQKIKVWWHSAIHWAIETGEMFYKQLVWAEK